MSRHYCSNAITFAPDSAYHANLKHVLHDLVSRAEADQGPLFFTSRGTSSGEAVFGSFMCKANISKKDCMECAKKARLEITSICRMTKVSILWYDQCRLHYSDADFHMKVYLEPQLSENNRGNIEKPEKCMELQKDPRGYAISTAAQHPPRKYEYGDAMLAQKKILDTFTQCLRYFSPDYCCECVHNATSSLLSLQTGETRDRVLLPSCYVRLMICTFNGSNSKGEMFVTRRSIPSFFSMKLSTPIKHAGEVHLKLKIFAAILTATVGLMLLLCIIVSHLLGERRRRVLRRESESRIEEDPIVRKQISELQSMQFHLQTIEAATNNFSDDNKLGEGGFGPVYKGKLPGGQEIAAKRLSRSSGQGLEEFKTEIELVAKLQHRNLVRLLGFSTERDETILVYEYVPHRSLDHLLFDPELSGQLDWSARHKVMVGVARGLLYLHEDSRLRIIHRDLKASNILLDADMNPKISDFGMARIFSTDQTQASTNRIVGTYGYMSPEYLMFGHFSVKSDVFSYGVLMLEIITGKKNSQFFALDCDDDLLGYVWKHWTNRTLSEVVDPALSNTYSMNEMIRCMHIGLLCVQDDMEDRPTMDSVILMLNSESISIPVPQRPSFFSPSKKYKLAPRGLNSDQSTSKVDQSNSKITSSWSASDSGSVDPCPHSRALEAIV